MSEYANMGPGRAAYLAFCQMPIPIDGQAPVTDEKRQEFFDNIAKAAVEANDWLRRHKPTEAIW